MFAMDNPMFDWFKYRYACAFHQQGKYMDIEFDFKGDPIGGVITNCKSFIS